MASSRRCGVSFSASPLLKAAWACIALLFILQPSHAGAYEPWWVQAHAVAELWSGPDSAAVSFGTAPQWSYFQVVAPQDGPRLYVLNPATKNYAYIDAAAVGPSSSPPPVPPPVPGQPAGTVPAVPAEPAPTIPEAPAIPSPVSPGPGTSALRTPPALPSDYKAWWVSNFEEAELWSSPSDSAPSLGHLPQFRRMLVVEPQQGNRIHVWSPENNLLGYVDALKLGPSGPSLWLTAKTPSPGQPVDLPGRSIGYRTYAYILPIFDEEMTSRRLLHNTAIQIQEKIIGADGAEWYRVGDREYVRAAATRLPRPATQPQVGKWIHADLNEPVMVTAYEDDRVVWTALAIKGITAFSTPQGVFQIFRRVENEEMDSETLIPPIPRDAPNGYHLKNVLYTQYFAGDGSSFHYNYWSSIFGYAGSHGCLGLSLEDSKWLWDWAAIGTTVVIE